MAKEPSKPLSIWRITWEGLKLSTKNIEFILPILIITLFTSSIQYLAEYHSAYPLVFDLWKNLRATPPSPAKDLKPLITKLAILQPIFTIASFIPSYCLLITVVNSISVTYLTPQATLRDLLARVKRMWKGPLITQLLVGVLSFACKLFILVIVVFVFWIAKNSLILLLLVVAIEFVGLFLYVKESIVWSFAVVISVVEDGYYGMKAILRAKELIEGRRKQWLAITFLIVIIEIVNAKVCSKHVVGGLLMVMLMKILKVVMLAAFTVFYYDCKKRRREDMVLSMEGIMYTGVPSNGYAEGDVV